MRVLAVTGNASLVVALGSMMRDWEVVTARNADEAMDNVQGAVVALIDLSDTSSGLEVADQLYRSGVTIPSVIIGDTIAEHPRASVLVRPFSLEDLGAAVKAAAERGSGPAAAPARPAPEPEPPAEQPLPPATSSATSERPSGRTGSPAAATAPTPAPEPEQQPTKQPAPGRRGGLSVVRHEPEPVAEEPEEIADEPVAPEPERTEPAASTADIMKSRLEELAAPPPPPVVEPAPSREPPAPEPQAPAAPAAPAARVEVPVSEPEPQQGGRWRRKRRAPQPAAAAEETEPPLVRRLKAAAGWAHEIEDLLAELPVLRDLWEMADALAGELEAQFAAQVGVVFALGEGGYHPVAHRGLSRVEAGMVVPDTQPLFSDVIRTQEGILIQPVDLAQGLVAGIGGARTEAMMAAPVVSEGACIAVVVVGGDRFAESDLDRLSDLATEAAPGIAVARLLQRLSGRTLG